MGTILLCSVALAGCLPIVRRTFGSARSVSGTNLEAIVSDINENQHHSRPSRFTLLIGLAVVLGVGVIVYWPEISAFTNIPQIKNALGL